jgi:hypothetical protein
LLLKLIQIQYNEINNIVIYLSPELESAIFCKNELIIINNLSQRELIIIKNYEEVIVKKLIRHITVNED